MLKKRIISAAALVLLCAVLLSGASLPINAGEGELVFFDLSDPASHAAEKTLKPSEFLSLLSGESIGEAEAKYIDSALDEALAYSDSVPISKVTVLYDGATVFVTAESYKYTSPSGAEVCFVPESVTLGEDDTELTPTDTAGVYECEIPYVHTAREGEGVYIDVNYSFEFTVKEKDADTYLNYAYRRAVEIRGEKSEYELQLAAYNKYTAYLDEMATYRSALAAYEDYLDAVEEYKLDLARYERYKSAYTSYKLRLEEYNAYRESVDSYPARLAAYEKYLADKAAYEKKVADYNAYCALADKATAKLAAIENVFVQSSKGKVLYNTLWGPTVGEVLDRQDELVNYGKVDPELILQTGDVTERLKELLRGYYELSEMSDKYNYYAQNYEAIKENLIMLYRNLHQLYENEAVYTGIVMKERLERYVEFVSHLYVLQSCLDDNYNIDSGWRIRREYDDTKLEYIMYGYKDVLEECQIPADTNNSSPADLPAWPAEVAKPTENDIPAEVEKPTVLPAVDKPIEPDEVDEPSEPDEVKKPDEPAYVAPADKPDETVYTENEKQILAALERGELSERTGEGDVKLTLDAFCRRLVPVDDRYVVTFYDDDGVTVLYRYFAGYRDVAEYVGETPTKASTGKYSYSFDGWKNKDGEAAVFSEVTEQETVFYASYKRQTNKYNVTWTVDGVETKETYSYGQTPYFKGELEKPEDEVNTYVFWGWDIPVEKVTGDAAYTAVYKAIPKKYTVTFMVDGKEYSKEYTYGETPSFTESTEKPEDSKCLYSFKGWDGEIVPVVGNATYTAVYESTNIAEDGDGNALEVTQSEADGEKILSVATEGGKIKADVLSEYAARKKARVSLSFLSGEVTVELSGKAVASFVELSAKYVSITKVDGESPEYSLLIESDDGERVTLSVPASVTVRLENADRYTRTFTLDENGVETGLAMSLSEGAVTVKLGSGELLRIRREYPITVLEFEGGVVTPDARETAAGRRIMLTLSVDDEYIVKGITVLGELSGEKYRVDGEYSFIMPDEPVKISVWADPRLYTVIFAADGDLISVKQYRKGEVIEKPADPVKEESDGKIYQFLEWDPLFTEGATVSGDVTYNAVFKELLVEDQKGFVPEEDNKFGEFILSLICCFAVFITVVTMLIIVIIKRIRGRR